MYVRVVVVTPRKLTDEQRELFEKLSQIEDPAAESDDGAGFWQTIKEALFD